MGYYCITFSCLSHVIFSKEGKEIIDEIIKSGGDGADGIPTETVSPLGTIKYKFGSKPSENIEIHDDDGKFIVGTVTNIVMKEIFKNDFPDLFFKNFQIMSMEFHILESGFINILIIFDCKKFEDLIKLSEFRGKIAISLKNLIHDIVDKQEFLYNLKYHRDILPEVKERKNLRERINIAGFRRKIASRLINIIQYFADKLGFIFEIKNKEENLLEKKERKNLGDRSGDATSHGKTAGKFIKIIHDSADKHGFIFDLKNTDVNLFEKNFDEKSKSGFKIGIPICIWDDAKQKCNNCQYEGNWVLTNEEWKNLKNDYTPSDQDEGGSKSQSHLELIIKKAFSEKIEPIYSCLYYNFYVFQGELNVWVLPPKKTIVEKNAPDEFFYLFKGLYLYLAERLVYSTANDVYIRLIEYINAQSRKDPFSSKSFRLIIAYYESLLAKTYLQRGYMEGWHVQFVVVGNKFAPKDEIRDTFRNLQNAASQIVERLDSEKTERSRLKSQFILLFFSALTLFTAYATVVTFVEVDNFNGMPVNLGFIPDFSISPIYERPALLAILIAFLVVLFIFVFINRKLLWPDGFAIKNPLKK